MIEEHDYPVTLRVTGPFTAHVSARDIPTTFDVSTPPEFGGPVGDWSPEHLYVASLSTCLMTTFQAIARISSIEVIEYEDEALGHLQRGEDKRYRMDTVTLRPRIVVPEGQRERAERLVDKAEEACLISRSVNTNVIVQARIEAPSVALS